MRIANSNAYHLATFKVRLDDEFKEKRGVKGKGKSEKLSGNT